MYGEHFLVQELRQDPLYHHRYLRMDKANFDWLLAKIWPTISKQRNHSFPIPSLRFLATGNSQISLGLSFRISPPTISRILRETLQAICDVLGPEILVPPTKESFAKTGAEFENRWDFPNACGSVDGKHIRIKCPQGSGSLCFNYKKFYSRVLFAVADANYRFLMVDIGQHGASSDAGIFDTSAIRKLMTDSDALPPPSTIKNGVKLPHVFLGDDAFQLQEHMMRPFPGNFIAKEFRIFNYRLSRARLVVENAFGILAARWRIFHSCIDANDDLVLLIIHASVILHNYLMQKNDWSGVTADSEVDGTFITGNWRNSAPENSSFSSISSIGSNNHSKDGFKIREAFKDYFNSEIGSVAWQNQTAFKG